MHENMVHGNVNTRVRNGIPKDGETIADDIEMDLVLKLFDRVDIYLRSKESCPFGRGNWIIDFYAKRNDPFPITSLKLPLEMTKEQIDIYCKPLVYLFRSKMN